MKKGFKIIFAVLTLLAMTALAGCEAQIEQPADPSEPGYSIAVEPSTPMESNVKKLYPEAEYVYVSSMNEGLMEVKTGKADAYCGSGGTVETAIKNGFEGVRIAEESVGDPAQVVVYISRYTQLENAKQLIDGYLEQVKADGTLDEMYERWVDNGDYTMPDIPEPEAPDKKITVATTGLLEPYTFTQDGELTGLDIENIKRFALYANAEIEIKTYDWSGIYTVLGTEKVDYGFSNMYLTDDASRVIDYSEPYHEIESVLVVASDDTAAQSFTEWFYDSLQRNFIEEDRWKLIAGGLAVTLKMTLLSAVFGTVLAFFLCQCKRSRHRAVARITDVITGIFRGVPLLVVLLMLYYVIFPTFDPVLTGIIAFSLSFSAAASEGLRGAVEGISAAQWEAASALGFTRFRTLTDIVLPQALRRYLPVYTGALVSLLQSTSIVGYIAITDVTYAVQLIRTRTFDPFIPLLASAAVYLILSYGLALLVKAGGNALLGSLSLVRGVNKDIKLTPYTARKFDGEKGELLVEVRGLAKQYADSATLKGLDCDIRRGDVISVIGPSGTGKSTLMRCINRLEQPTAGSIRIFGQDVAFMQEKELPAIRRRIGMVFQQLNLFEHLTVVENVMIAQVKLDGASHQDAYEKSMNLLAAVGLADKAMHYPSELSGGQKQRAAIVRALAMEPEIMLFDEPTSALDPRMIGEVLIVIEGLSRYGMTMMIVTHEMDFARQISTKVFYMDQGTVYESGTPEQVFEAPQTDLCRAFMRERRILRGIIYADNFDLPAEFSKVIAFAEKYHIGQPKLIKLFQLIEELCLTLIIKETGNDIEYEASYDADGDICEMILQYGGAKFDPLNDADDELAAKLAAAKTRRFAHAYSITDRENMVTIEF